MFNYTKKTKDKIKKHGKRNFFVFILSCCFFVGGIILIWLSTLQIPALNQIEERKISQSTKIYDSTGKILLYDIYQTQKRTIIPFEDISHYIKDATLSIEDKTFYTNIGIKPLSIMRALFVDLTTLHFTQGASTITQQVVKNSLLTGDKTPTRKLKELVITLKLEKILSKDQIFSMYLNEIPYGGSLYGVEEASQAFFGISAKDVDLAQAAYLAALPQAPSYYSPYGKHLDALEIRKNLVLKEMFDDGKITKEELAAAAKEKVIFLSKSDGGIKAPHFVMYVIDYLKKQYGSDVLEQGGLRVYTTLNYNMQQKAESVAKEYALSNEKNFNGSNDAFVALDPKTGAILTMVGSRDYFDKKIDGNFNVAISHRQPGSTFKPFVYAEAFTKGYTPDTVLFDLKTQFSTNCSPDNFTSDNGCYSPSDYDDKTRGPMTLRDALAQSINIPAVKLLYLTGIADSIKLAKAMGIEGLGDPNQYGLTLVLGGGEVSLLDMTSAYGVFATEGERNPYFSIWKVTDTNGSVLEEHKKNSYTVLDSETARKISDILGDNNARIPLYGANSALYFPGRDLAAKTGTTNDYRDAWIIGYTPDIVVGTWAGNNDNTPMQKKVSGLLVAPMWRAFMNQIINDIPNNSFIKPQNDDSYELKPVLRGKWQGGVSNISNIQNTTGTSSIPYNSIQESLSGGVHSILYWIDKDNPRGDTPQNPAADPQFVRWEYPVRLWAAQNGYQ